MNTRDPLQDFGTRQGQENVAALAQRKLSTDPLLYLLFQLSLSIFSMTAAAGIDLMLNYSLMAAGMSDAFGHTPEATGLWLGSGVMLIGYYALSLLYKQSFELRRLAFVGYAAMVSVLALLVFPVQGPRINEMWSSLFSGNPFAGGYTGSQVPMFIMIPMVIMIAILYTGPGLFAVWSHGRFSHWIERIRHWKQARDTLALARQAQDSEEALHQADMVIQHFSDPAQLAAVIRSALRQGVGIYAAEIERKAKTAQDARLDLATPKVMKQQAELDFEAAARCKASLQNIVI